MPKAMKKQKIGAGAACWSSRSRKRGMRPHIYSSERFNSESLREQAHGPPTSSTVPVNLGKSIKPAVHGFPLLTG